MASYVGVTSAKPSNAALVNNQKKTKTQQEQLLENFQELNKRYSELETKMR